MLEINGRLITAPIEEILREIQREAHKNLFKDMRRQGKNLLVTCPNMGHKGGQEAHPSCQIFNDPDDDLVEYGFVHCFTCGYKVPLYKMVADCFDVSEDWGKKWLIQNFSDILMERKQFLPEITFTKSSVPVLDESILKQYEYFHPYMKKRKLTDEVIKKYRIGYDPETSCITFPVWDEHNKLIMITKRSVLSKAFYIPDNVEKPVYLLNFLQNGNQKVKQIYVAESQINTLTLLSWGYNAVGLFGTGCRRQYEILKKSGFRNFVLCLDGDDAGMRGTERFIKNMPEDTLITVKKIPWGKDVNDLTKEEFEKLPLIQV